MNRTTPAEAVGKWPARATAKSQATAGYLSTVPAPERTRRKPEK